MMKGNKKCCDKKKKESFHRKISFLNKNFITFFLIILCDVFLVIYCARYNKANYVKILNENIFVGNTSNLVFGRNYVNVIITLFFYFYIVIMNRYFLKRKNTRRFMISSLLFLVILNILLFFIFTVRVY